MPRADASRRRCAIYTRKSSEEGLEQEFNSLAAQREACEAFICSQRHEGWVLARNHYDDGGFSGGNLERPALQRLLDDIRASRIDIVVVYKVDRLTRSLADFARLVELFDAEAVSFVSVTQQFNTTSSMGRLTLNVLLSFAQFEREVTGERIRSGLAGRCSGGAASRQLPKRTPSGSTQAAHRTLAPCHHRRDTAASSRRRGQRDGECTAGKYRQRSRWLCGGLLRPSFHLFDDRRPYTPDAAAARAYLAAARRMAGRPLGQGAGWHHLSRSFADHTEFPSMPAERSSSSASSRNGAPISTG